MTLIDMTCKRFNINAFDNIYSASFPILGLGKRVSVWQGDLITVEADAIVNSSNSEFLVGIGLDRKIHDAAGEELGKACRNLPWTDEGGAAITNGYNLLAKRKMFIYSICAMVKLTI